MESKTTSSFCGIAHHMWILSLVHETTRLGLLYILWQAFNEILEEKVLIRFHYLPVTNEKLKEATKIDAKTLHFCYCVVIVEYPVPIVTFRKFD